MRFGVADLLISIACMAFGILVNFMIAVRISLVFSLMLGTGIYLVVTPWIYQKLCFRPLWFPLCPQCKDKNRLYYAPTVQPDWPMGEITCARCLTKIELRYNSEKNEAIRNDAVCFQLVWPQSWGRWRRIKQDEDKADEKIKHCHGQKQSNGSGLLDE